MNDDLNFEELSKSELIEFCKDCVKSRDRVFSIASHDLRSPFSGLLGLSELLAAGYEDMKHSEIEEYLCTMHDSLKNTYKLLENLFEWGQIERNKFNKTIELIPLKIVVDETLVALGQEVSNKGLEIIHLYDSEQLVKANSRMLEFILKNFLSNAVKFSNREGKIEIGCKTSDDGTVISVRDYGLGITEANMNNLFKIDVNWRILGTEGEGGTGLGLLASNRYAESFGAAIKVESAPGEGSTFSLILSESPA